MIEQIAPDVVVIMADLNFKSTTVVPQYFRGTLIGNGCTLSNIVISQPVIQNNSAQFGLFTTGRITIYNLTLSNFTIIAKDHETIYAGAICAKCQLIADNLKIQGLLVSTSMKNVVMGGVGGELSDSVITKSIIDVKVSAKTVGVGGVCGFCENLTINSTKVTVANAPGIAGRVIVLAMFGSQITSNQTCVSNDAQFYSIMSTVCNGSSFIRGEHGSVSSVVSANSQFTGSWNLTVSKLYPIYKPDLQGIDTDLNITISCGQCQDNSECVVSDVPNVKVGSCECVSGYYLNETKCQKSACTATCSCLLGQCVNYINTPLSTQAMWTFIAVSIFVVFLVVFSFVSCKVAKVRRQRRLDLEHERGLQKLTEAKAKERAHGGWRPLKSAKQLRITRQNEPIDTPQPVDGENVEDQLEEMQSMQGNISVPPSRKTGRNDLSTGLMSNRGNKSSYTDIVYTDHVSLEQQLNKMTVDQATREVQLKSAPKRVKVAAIQVQEIPVIQFKTKSAFNGARPDSGNARRLKSVKSTWRNFQ